MDFPRISAADLAEAVWPLTDAEASRVPTRLDRWRSENPDELRTWTTKLGCVVQFWGVRLYYGLCKDCGGLVTDRRSVARFRGVVTNIGRWKERCEGCARLNDERHEDNARHRMARLRRQRREVADSRRVAAGMKPGRQGVAVQDRTRLAQSSLDAAELRLFGRNADVEAIVERYLERQV